MPSSGNLAWRLMSASSARRCSVGLLAQRGRSCAAPLLSPVRQVALVRCTTELVNLPLEQLIPILKVLSTLSAGLGACRHRSEAQEREVCCPGYRMLSQLKVERNKNCLARGLAERSFISVSCAADSVTYLTRELFAFIPSNSSKYSWCWRSGVWGLSARTINHSLPSWGLASSRAGLSSLGVCMALTGEGSQPS